MKQTNKLIVFKNYLRNIWIVRKLFGIKGEKKDWTMIVLFWWNILSIIMTVILVIVYSSTAVHHPEWDHQKILPKPYGTIIGVAFLFLMCFIVGVIFMILAKMKRRKKNK